MTAQDIITGIQSLPQNERTKVEAWLRERDDAADLAVLEQRKDEPVRDLRAVLSDLGITSG